ncbi:hypothetical protein [Hymenobacter psoromatis]|uniref:hypothetical protein n=1 Tax=Hymenobacter psoromatis TaxID=1484116 RepID=UPI001CBEA909|nr:hypothetical protein [Hymenobacter psoromatis]
MNPAFDQRVARLPGYLAQLIAQIPRTRLALGQDLPAAGVYAFYEHGHAQYVGRTGRLRQRLLEHGGNASSHYSASFAFLLAREAAQGLAIDLDRPRHVLQRCPLFGPLFTAAKARVAGMEIRWIAVADDVEQTLFEVYAALALNTPHNHFNPS